MALARRTRASGVTPSARARMRASGDFGIRDGAAAALDRHARFVDFAGRDAEGAQEGFAVCVVGFGIEAEALADDIVADDPAGEGGGEAEPFFQSLFDAVQRVFRQAAGFQAIAFKAVDLVERAGAEDTQADIFRLGLAGDGTEGGVDAFGELRGLFVFLREQEVDRVCAAAFGGEPADGGGQCVFGGDGAGGLLGNAADLRRRLLCRLRCHRRGRAT
jgi:hypothetical protein